MPDPREPRFAQEGLIATVTALFESAGCRREDAQLVAGYLVRAEASGLPSHGLVRVPVYLERLRSGGNDPAARPRIVSEEGASAVVDGDGALGQVVATFAMRRAIELARQQGTGAVACRNSSHFGSAADYALLAPASGCIGIAITNASPTMPPWGGVEPLLGNNPLALAAPTSGEPFVLDMALSVAAKGKIRLLAARGDPIPAGWATDAAGRPTVDPQLALAGFAAWMGAHKGYGLALAADALSGVLSGGAYGPEVGSQNEHGEPQRVGHFFLAIDVEHFLPLEDFRARFGEMLARVRASTPADGVPQVMVPGETEAAARAESAERGVAVEERVWSQLAAEAERAGVALPGPV